MTHSFLMTSRRESEPALAADADAPLSLRHILGAPPVDTWWSRHRNLLWSFTGWVTSVAVVVSAGYLLWAMMFHHESDADPFLGLQRPRATSTTAAPLDHHADVADVVKVVRPEPLTVATTINGVAPEGTTASLGSGTGGSGRSGPNPGPGGPASPTTEASGSGGTTSSTGTSGGGDGGNRGPGGSSSTSAATTTTTRSTSTSTSTTSTTRPTSSTSTSSTVDDKGGGSGSGSGSGGGSGSGSGSGGSGKG